MATQKKAKTTSTTKIKKTAKIVKTVKPAASVKPEKKAKIVKTARAVKKAVAAEQAQSMENKQQIIEVFAQKPGDTGSPEVQVALLSFKITRLTSHLDINKKDNHSRRGLLKVIAKRRRILNYLQKLDDKRYKELLKKVNLKK